MPTYEYACTQCGERLEVFLRFGEDQPTECPVCGGALRKVFHPAGILFKGSGFYKTDSRSAAKSGAGSKGDSKSESRTESEPKTDSKSGSKGSSDPGSKSDKKPASKPAEKSA